MKHSLEELQQAYKLGEERGWRRGLSWSGIIAAISVLGLLLIQWVFIKFFRA